MENLDLLLATELLPDDDRLQNEAAHEMLPKTVTAIAATVTVMHQQVDVGANEDCGSAHGSDKEQSTANTTY